MFSVNPGDLIFAEVKSASPTQFTLTLTDKTSVPVQTFTVPATLPTAAHLSSAEWIAEAPTDPDLPPPNPTDPLADFIAAHFIQNDATVAEVTGPIGSFASKSPIKMVSNGTPQVDYGTVQAVPSRLSTTNKSSFVVGLTWGMPGAPWKVAAPL
jgi:hypothetical protein